MRKIIVGGIFAVAFAVVFGAVSLDVVSAQIVVCPSGFTCTRISASSPNIVQCPTGYVCTTATNTSNACYVFSVDLSVAKNSSHKDVAVLQKFLADKGFYTAPTDPSGVYGIYTGGAVGWYQESVGITPGTGYVGPLTRSKLNAACMGGSTTTVTPPVSTQTPVPIPPVTQSSAPVIDSLSLSSGPAGTRVTVNVRNFPDHANNSISFHSVKGGGTSFGGRPQTAGLIQFSVPNYPPGVYEVAVQNDLTGNSNKKQFTITAPAVSATAPVIMSLDNPVCPPGCEVTITGTGFERGDMVQVSGGETATVNAILTGSTKLTFKVPTLRSGSSYSLFIVRGNVAVSAAKNFTVAGAPYINLIPASGKVGDKIVVSGNYLIDHPNNSISFHGVNGGGTNFGGRITANGTLPQATFVVPNYPPGQYTVQLVSDINGMSNLAAFTILSTSVQSVSPSNSPMSQADSSSSHTLLGSVLYSMGDLFDQMWGTH